MRSLHRTSRIQMRCTPAEARNIRILAELLDISTADFIRDAVTISIASNPNRSQWDRKLATAIMRISDRSPWSTS